MAAVSTPRLAELADQLMADIRSRGLQPGDRYLTTAEASRLLGVGNGAANRALQLLERRRVITRQQRRGAHIAEPIPTHQHALQRVHFLVHQKYLRTEGIGQDEVLLGIEHELPGVPVQISFLPTGNEALFVQELLDDSTRMKRTDGFVLVRTSYETQRLLDDRQVPAVIFGTAFPSIHRLSSLAVDMYGVGVILTEYLLQRGHGCLAYYNRQLTYGGDQRTMEGMAATLQQAGLGLNSMTTRFLPQFDEVAVAESQQLLDRPDPPTGFICRTARLAEAVAVAAAQRGQVVGRDVDIAVCNYYLKSGEAPRFPWARPTISSEEQGRGLARMLVHQTEHGDAAERQITPVTLELPNSDSGERY